MRRNISLAALTELMSKVGRDKPALVGDRNVTLFIQACIEEARNLPMERPPRAPVGDPRVSI